MLYASRSLKILKFLQYVSLEMKFCHFAEIRKWTLFMKIVIFVDRMIENSYSELGYIYISIPKKAKGIMNFSWRL